MKTSHTEWAVRGPVVGHMRVHTAWFNTLQLAVQASATLPDHIERNTLEIVRRTRTEEFEVYPLHASEQIKHEQSILPNQTEQETDQGS